MRNIFLLAFILSRFVVANTQTFSSTVNQTIPDNNTTVTFDIIVTGLPNVIDTLFGLEKACLNMTHTYDSDMEIKLKAPDGTTVVLFSGVGGGDDDFTNTCLEGSGTPISAGTAPFTGSFMSMGVLGNINNGQNPNGTWQLLCRDMAAVDIGFLIDWSITFGNNAAHPFLFSSSNLPIVKLTTVSAPINNNVKVPVLMQIIDNGAGNRNYTNQTNYAYTGTIMTEWQGFSSPYNPRKNYDFQLIDSLGNARDTTIISLPREHDWIFKAEYTDNSLIKNMLTYEMARRMGGYAPRTQPCEIILDGEYIGYYTLTEKVKRDANRVDIAKLDSTDISGVNLTGGYIIEMNINGDPADWTSNYLPVNYSTCSLNVEYKHVYPKTASILPVQHNYIHAYVDSFEIALNGPGYLNPTTGYRKFIDVPGFIDFLIVNEFSVNYDSYGRSTYLYKQKLTDGGKLVCGPPWDYDRAMDYNNPPSSSGWVWQITHPGWPFPFWWSRFWTDVSYRKQLACRWKMLRQVILHTDSFIVHIDSLTSRINEAQGRNFTVWNTLGNMPYPVQIDSLKSFVTRRLNWIDATLAQQNVSIPVFYLPTDTLLCEGTLYNASIGNQYTYNWHPGPSTSSITLTLNGTYGLTVTDANGCYSEKEMIVTISQPDASFTTQVSGSLYTFTPTNQNANAYAWDFGDGATSALMNPTHTYSHAGNFIVTLTLHDSINCPKIFSDTLNVIQAGLQNEITFGGEIYPNPFDQNINLRFGVATGTECSISILNELGQTLFKEIIPAGSSSNSVSTTMLPAGVYIVNIQMGDNVWKKKMMKL